MALVEQALANEILGMEMMPPAVKTEADALIEAQRDSLLEAEADLNRVSVDLLQRASDLDQVLAKLHALER